MGRMITKTNDILQRLLKQKGQGLTEFVLVLAFCAVIGWIASEVGFMDAIGAVFDSGKRPETVTAAIGGGKSSVTPTPTPTPDPDPDPNPDPNPNPDVTYNEFDWGKIDPKLYYQKAYKDETASRDGGNSTIDFTVDSGKEDRLLSDQQALANLATHFIGMRQGDVSKLFIDENLTADMGKNQDGENVVLGHLMPVDDANVNGAQGMRLSADRGDDNLKEEYRNEILKWMKTPAELEKIGDDDTYMYMVSDYVVSQGWAAKRNNKKVNGIHLRLEYDYSEQFEKYDSLADVKVVGVHIAIDPGSQKNKKTIAKYNGQSSAGLDVHVRKVSETENQVTFYDTADAFDENGVYVAREITTKDGRTVKLPGNKAQGLYNWYHESYRDLVINYLKDYWVLETIPSGSGIVTKDYNQGDIIKIGGDFYVVTKTARQTINSSHNQTNLEANGLLVKITNGLYNNYNASSNFIHENDLKTFNTATYFQYRGFAVTLSNGDVYIYVGQQGQSYNINANFVSTEVDANGDPLFIKVGNVSNN